MKMLNDVYFKCELRSKNNNDRIKHQQRCRDWRRILFKLKIKINSFTDKNSSQKRKIDFLYDDVIKKAFVKQKTFVKEKAFVKKKAFMKKKKHLWI
jgi:hypothetical protein